MPGGYCLHKPPLFAVISVSWALKFSFDRPSRLHVFSVFFSGPAAEDPFLGWLVSSICQGVRPFSFSRSYLLASHEPMPSREVPPVSRPQLLSFGTPGPRWMTFQRGHRGVSFLTIFSPSDRVPCERYGPPLFFFATFSRSFRILLLVAAALCTKDSWRKLFFDLSPALRSTLPSQEERTARAAFIHPRIPPTPFWKNQLTPPNLAGDYFSLKGLHSVRRWRS